MSEKEQIEQLKLLNDIYLNENEQLKMEYMLLQYEYDQLQYKINKNILIRIYRKFKNLLRKIRRFLGKVKRKLLGRW